MWILIIILLFGFRRRGRVLWPKPLGYGGGAGIGLGTYYWFSGSLLAGRLPLRLRCRSRPLNLLQSILRPSKSTLAARLPVFLFRNQLWNPACFLLNQLT